MDVVEKQIMQRVLIPFQRLTWTSNFMSSPLISKIGLNTNDHATLEEELFRKLQIKHVAHSRSFIHSCSLLS